MPRVVATDLDGTLLRADGTVSDRTRAALARVEEAGSTLVFVTGRPPRWLTPVVEETGHRGLAICANGALVYDAHTERVVDEHPLLPDVAAKLVAALRDALPEIAFAAEGPDQTFGHESGYRLRYDVGGARVVTAEELVGTPMVKLLARHDGFDADALLAKAREVAGDLATFTHSSNDGLLEISGVGISKASALETLARDHGAAAADVLAFGDMPNDLPMLEWAGHSVGVANAHPDVLALVDEVTARNDEDGVAAVIERYFPG